MENWTGKRVLIIGAARQGLALARFLCRQGAEVTLNDRRTGEQLEKTVQAMKGFNLKWVFNHHDLNLLEETDMVCLSGGVSVDLPLAQEAIVRGLTLSNDTEIFLSLVPCRVIGITGSAGKTTTTTLVARIAEADIKLPVRVWVGGNIGLPLIDHLSEIKPNDLVILEISSFQLELMTRSPQIGAILNITPNHLDRHGSIEAYTSAKARLLNFQTSRDTAILDRDDPGAWNLVNQVRGRLVTFSLNPLPNTLEGVYLADNNIWLQTPEGNQQVMSCQVINLRGSHNLRNILAACAITYAAGISIESMVTGVAGFKGVDHRLEWVRNLREINWYNDSIATAPERTIAAIQSFTEPIVLLLGGRDKNLPWEDLAELIHQRVDHIVVFGEAAEKILTAIGPVFPGKKPLTIDHCKGLQSAIEAAARVATPGAIVLLSPGGTSFDEFIDFEERGESYRRWVKQLT
jgi:UDP-N-acetylmuramoylalanine--D-glutamate ligase